MNGASDLPGTQDPGRLHPLTLVAGPVRVLGGWIVPLLVALVLGLGTEGRFQGGFFILAGLAVIVGRQLVEYLRLRWWVEGDSVELRTGFLKLEQRSLPLDRIHNVDVVEPFAARIVGLAEVRIESAASGVTDIVLRYIPVADALAVRDRLTGRMEAGADDEPADAEPPGRVLVETPVSELFVAGATSNRIGALAAGVGAVGGILLEAGLDPEEVVEETVRLVPVGFMLVSLLVVAAIVVGWVVSIAESVLRFGGFTLVLQGDEARRSHGLLTRASGRIPLPRVQTVRVEQPFLRRWLGRATILADTAGSLVAGTSSGTGVVAPIIDARRVAELVSIMLRRPDTDAEGLEAVSKLAIRRGFVRATLPAGVVAGLLAWLLSPWWLVGLGGWALGAWVWANRRWKAIGYRLEPDLMVVRSGVFTRRIWFIPTSKVQSVAVRRTLFQRRLGLASLRIDSAATADGVVTVVDLTEPRAHALAERLADRSSVTALAADAV